MCFEENADIGDSSIEEGGQKRAHSDPLELLKKVDQPAVVFDEFFEGIRYHNYMTKITTSHLLQHTSGLNPYSLGNSKLQIL
jgi:hypothetical protein